MVPYHGIFRKPSPGCLYYLFQHILGLPFSLNTVQSIPCAFVGDSAGRHGDYSDVDVLLAINAHFKFYTTEAFFLDSTDPHDTVIKKEDLPSFNPIQYRTDYKMYLPSFQAILQSVHACDYVFLIGPSHSGKTWFQQHYLQDYEKFRSKQTLCSLIQANKKGFIDEMVNNKDKRQQFLKCIKSSHRSAVCLIFTQDKEICNHMKHFQRVNISTSSLGSDVPILNLFIETVQRDGQFQVISDTCVNQCYNDIIGRSNNKFFKSYVRPTKEEGFCEVYDVPLIPGPFKSSIDEDLFFCYL